MRGNDARGQTALFLLCVALATCAQSLSGFAFALILLGLAGLLELAPLADLANVATVLGLANALVALRGSRRHLDVPAFRDPRWAAPRAFCSGCCCWAGSAPMSRWSLRVLLGLTVMACAVIVLQAERGAA